MNARMAAGLATGIAVVVMWVTVPAFGADNFAHTWWRVAFETPVAFSEPIRVGLGGVALVHPPEQGLGQGRMEITLVALPKDLQADMGNDDRELRAFVKTTFLGADRPAETSREQVFLGQTVEGDVQTVSIPKPGELELYLVTLSDGDKVAVGLNRDDKASPEEARRIMDLVARTFKEVQEP